jgi:hypothetical protein
MESLRNFLHILQFTHKFKMNLKETGYSEAGGSMFISTEIRVIVRHTFTAGKKA